PVSTVDPDGEEPITLGAIAIAAAIGAGTSAVAYTASIALSDGGFNNWDWGQFGEGVAIGAFSGVMTFGIGEGFKTAAEVGKLTKTTADILKTATHATFQGGLSAAQGGDFLTAFASGAIGGGIGSQAAKLGNAATIGASMLMGGATAELSGGDFWKGAAISGIVAGANDVAHRVVMTPEERAKLKMYREIRRIERQIENGQIDLSDPNAGQLLVDRLRVSFMDRSKNRGKEGPFLHELVDMKTRLSNSGGYGSAANRTRGNKIVLGKKVDVTIFWVDKIKGGSYDASNAENQVHAIRTNLGKQNPVNKIIYSSVEITNGGNDGALIRFQVVNDPAYVQKLRKYLLGR
ncbi:MAG: hypothetical protein AAF693_22330, partial [Bacteroidota bacterium]